MYYTVIKHSSHLRTLEKCRKHSPAARAFYISLVFSNACRVLSQCNTRLRLLYLLNNNRLPRQIVRAPCVYTSAVIYSGIPISRTVGFPNLPISRTKLCFPWIFFTQALQFYPRFLETPDNSNQFWLPWVKLTLDKSNQRTFPNHSVQISITFTSLNKLTLSDKLFSRILVTQQASRPQSCHQSER